MLVHDKSSELSTEKSEPAHRLDSSISAYRHWLKNYYAHAEDLGINITQCLDLIANELATSSSNSSATTITPSLAIIESMESNLLTLKQHAAILKLETRQSTFSVTQHKDMSLSKLEARRTQLRTEQIATVNKLKDLKRHRSELHSHIDKLLECINPELIRQQINHSHRQLQSSWTTHGLARAMDTFFATFATRLSDAQKETKICNQLLNDVYSQYDELPELLTAENREINLAPHIQALSLLQRQATKFKRHYRTMLTQKSGVIERFKNTLIEEAQALSFQIYQDLKDWPDMALSPILQHTSNLNRLLSKQIAQTEAIYEQTHQSHEQLIELRRHLKTTKQAQTELVDILRASYSHSTSEANAQNIAAINASRPVSANTPTTGKARLAP